MALAATANSTRESSRENKCGENENQGKLACKLLGKCFLYPQLCKSKVATHLTINIFLLCVWGGSHLLLSQSKIGF
jgi:hypothetical protein